MVFEDTYHVENGVESSGNDKQSHCPNLSSDFSHAKVTVIHIDVDEIISQEDTSGCLRN